jgi:hypothetical protein
LRTIFRLCLVGAIVASLGLAAVPVADAKHKPGAVHVNGKASHHKDKRQNRRIRKARRRAERAHDRIATLKEFAFGLASKNEDQDTQFNALRDLVNAATPVITKALTDLEAGLLALQAALEDDVGPALEAIDAALNDETTGLVGLNLARPQFGAFAADGTILGGTGQVEGASGPEADADKGGSGPPDVDGMYVVDFGNDVSERMYTVNVFPYLPAGVGGGGTTPYGSAINCANAGIDAVCGIVQDGGAAPPDADPNKVLVQIGDGASGGAVNGFSVTALSG